MINALHSLYETKSHLNDGKGGVDFQHDVHEPRQIGKNSASPVSSCIQDLNALCPFNLVNAEEQTHLPYCRVTYPGRTQDAKALHESVCEVSGD